MLVQKKQKHIISNHCIPQKKGKEHNIFLLKDFKQVFSNINRHTFKEALEYLNIPVAEESDHDDYR